MGCGASANSKETQLTIPQRDSPELKDKRNKVIAENKKAYALQANPGLPSWLKSVPKTSDEMDVKGVWELTKVFYRLWDEKMGAKINLWKQKIINSEESKKPFGRFKAVFGDEELPKVHSVWQNDDEYGYEHLNGLFPEFVAKCPTVHPAFVGADVAKQLPAGKTLEAMAAEGRLFISDVTKSLIGVKPQRNHVMVSSMCLFIVDDEKRFMPIAITLQPEGGLVFTPNDPPGLWLAVKIHHTCAEFQIHTLRIHALEQHLMVEPVWATLNQAMSPRHPVHAFLKPHMWNTVFVNEGVRASLLEEADATLAKGALQEILQSNKDGAVTILKTLYGQIGWKDWFDIPKRFEKNGVMDIPNYHFRDQVMRLWKAIRTYADDFLKAIYPKDEDFTGDTELKAWVEAMLDPNEGAINGVPCDEAKKCFSSKDDLASFLTMVIYQAAIRHSHVENAALVYYPWVCGFPASYALPVPTTRDDIALEVIDAALPDQQYMVQQIALIDSVNVPEEDIRHLSQIAPDFLKAAGDDANAASVKFKKALDEIETAMGLELTSRKGKNPVSDDFLKPSRMAASIWN